MGKVATNPGSCGVNKQLNRDWALQAKPRGADASEYNFVPGLNSINVLIETGDVDASDIDSRGWKSKIKTSRTFKVAGKGSYMSMGDATDLHPAIRLLIETGESLGSAGEFDIRVWRTDGFCEGWEATVTVQYTPESGSADDLRSYSVDMQSTCEPRKILPVLVGEEKKESKALAERPPKVKKSMALPADRSGGTFTITVEKETTRAIKHDADASTIQKAVAALSTATDVQVTGSENSFVIEYNGKDSITGTATALTGGSASSTGIKFT